MPTFLEFPEEASEFMANELSQDWEVSGRWLLQIDGLGQKFKEEQVNIFLHRKIYTEVSY